MGKYNGFIWKYLQTMIILVGCGDSDIKLYVQILKQKAFYNEYSKKNTHT